MIGKAKGRKQSLSLSDLPFTLFCLTGVVVQLAFLPFLLSNPLDDYITAWIFTGGIISLLFATWYGHHYSVSTALFFVILIYNGLIYWITVRYGRETGVMFYYFPFMVGFLFIFVYNRSHLKKMMQVIPLAIFCLLTMGYAGWHEPIRHIPEPVLSVIYGGNIFFSVVDTVLILNALYRRFNQLNKQILSEQQKQNRILLRNIDLLQEKQDYALLLSLRDDISQNLATSRLYLQSIDDSSGVAKKADEGLKRALETLNSISRDLSPAVITDMDFEQGLLIFGDQLSRKYDMPVTVEQVPCHCELPQQERLSLIRMITHCTNILATTGQPGFMNFSIHCDGNLRIRIEHGADEERFSDYFLHTTDTDLSKRISYYNAQIREGAGWLELRLDMQPDLVPE